MMRGMTKGWEAREGGGDREEKERRQRQSEGEYENLPLGAAGVTESSSESTVSDFSSENGDEESTLVEERKEDREGEELHLTQSEAQAMMMNFLAKFTRN
jgi:hypothetical protein